MTETAYICGESDAGAFEGVHDGRMDGSDEQGADDVKVESVRVVEELRLEAVRVDCVDVFEAEEKLVCERVDLTSEAFMREDVVSFAEEVFAGGEGLVGASPRACSGACDCAGLCDVSAGGLAGAMREDGVAL